MDTNTQHGHHIVILMPELGHIAHIRIFNTSKTNTYLTPSQTIKSSSLSASSLQKDFFFSDFILQFSVTFLGFLSFALIQTGSVSFLHHLRIDHTKIVGD
ncbi:hypothetical protein QVD17_30145 [Tagetes erecta]|uniref:Uncharacterized protein n=1 Tax=Tagetes erecta TaxID=13708 RepID=A0AAD8K4W9_TARER|nr:hypothetical protein QVD17_30145 [Tagetes erecta]